MQRHRIPSEIYFIFVSKSIIKVSFIYFIILSLLPLDYLIGLLNKSDFAIGDRLICLYLLHISIDRLRF